MRYRYVLLLLIINFSNIALSQTNKKHTISGFVKEKGSGELLIGVNIYLPDKKIGTATNTFGFYSLTLPAEDSVTLIYSFVGYNPQVKKIALTQDLQINIELESNLTLQEVVITAETQKKVSESVQMSNIEIPIWQIKSVPALLGEKDVLKVIQLMPGVQKGSEGNSGIYVRGGGPDQNLLILDDAVVYNAYHLFGFFSLFNGDALKSVELTKGGFPARYGGRLSSVIDMNLKEGNKEKLHGEGGIGIISSKLTLEGPIVKNKSSFLISGRRTYADAITRPLMPKNEKGGYYFYDLNAKLNYDFGRNNKLYLSGYFGQDKFSYNLKESTSSNGANFINASSGGFNWGNATGTLRWNHLFNDKLFANTSLIFSNYKFLLSIKNADQTGEYNLKYSSGIRDLALKYDWDYLPDHKHSIKFGFLSTYHRFTPSAIVIKNTDASQFQRRIRNIDVIESGVYIEDTYKPLIGLKINGGLRLTQFHAINKNYLNLEPRIATSYSLSDELSVKASYALMNQYVHLVSNTGIGLPTDLWVPTTARIAPQRSQQVALGLAKDFTSRKVAVTLEGYYKKMDHIIAYKEGASFLLLNDGSSSTEVNWEDNITQGQGWSYGTELLIQKKVGKFSGWIGYTLSWTQVQFDSLNSGQKYYARYDRRHDISLVGIYKLSDRITLSGTWVYGSGNAITLPVAEYKAFRPIHGNDDKSTSTTTRKDYGPKNSFRMAPYHRLDLGIQFHKKKKWGERTWEISVYNAYNRKNPFFYSVASNYDAKTKTQRTYLSQVTLFPIIPSISYSFKF